VGMYYSGERIDKASQNPAIIATIIRPTSQLRADEGFGSSISIGIVDVGCMLIVGVLAGIVDIGDAMIGVDVSNTKEVAVIGAG